LDVITKNLAMALGSSLAESLSALSSSSHVDKVDVLCCGCFGDDTDSLSMEMDESGDVVAGSLCVVLWVFW
jgi:hypothetical protein